LGRITGTQVGQNSRSEADLLSWPCWL